MKNKELLELYEFLHKINLKGVKFSYAIAKNISIIKPEVESLQKSIDMTEEYKEFDAKRIELAKKHAKKDKNGEPLVVDKNYVPENEAELEKKFAVLKEENKELVEARKKQMDEFNELLDKQNDVKLYKISIKDIPEEISSQQMTQIFQLIEE